MKLYQLKELKYRFQSQARKWFRDLIVIGSSVLVAYITFTFAISESGQRLDLQQLHYFFNERGTTPPPPELVIASIDDDTVMSLHADPRLFPRIHTATGLEKIVNAGPRVVILDINFPKEPYDPKADDVLTGALERGPTTIWSGQMATADAKLLGTDAFTSLTFPSDERFIHAAKMELPMWTLQKFGMRAQIAADVKDGAELYSRAPLSKPLVELAKYDIVAPGAQDFINFYGPEKTIKSVSLQKILTESDEDLRNDFGNKVVLMGFQTGVLNRGLGNKDEFPVPVSDKDMFGVEIHANIVGNLIDRSWLKRMTPEHQFLFIFLISLWMCWIGIRTAPEKGMPTILLFLGISAYFSYWEFTRNQIFIPSIIPIFFAGIVSLFLSFALNYKTFKARFTEINERLNFKRSNKK